MLKLRRSRSLRHLSRRGRVLQRYVSPDVNAESDGETLRKKFVLALAISANKRLDIALSNLSALTSQLTPQQVKIAEPAEEGEKTGRNVGD